MADPTLLPPNATALLRAVTTVNGEISAIPVPLTILKDPWRCPADLLPWLAWELSVDFWDEDWSEATKRAVIAASFDTHRFKGTVWSIKTVIAAVLNQTPIILEGLHRRRHDGSISRNGRFFHGWAAGWACYRVVLERPITNRQADQVRQILAAIAPKRSHLLSLDYVECAAIHNGVIRRDGTYNYGIA